VIRSSSSKWFLLLSVLGATAFLAGIQARSARGAETSPPPTAGVFSPGGLTADEAARRASTSSFDVRARVEERAAAEAAVSQADAAFLPRLSGTARYARLSNLTPPSLGNLVVAPPDAPPGQPPDPNRLAVFPVTFPTIVDQYAALASLQVPLSDYLLRLPQARAAATATARGAALTEQATRLRVATEARLSYYAWVRARLEGLVAEENVQRARGHLDDVRKSADAGAASRADVLRVESQVASAELLVTRARNLAAVAEERLRTVMHDDARRPYEVGEDVASAPVSGPLAESLAALRAEAASRRLEPRALDADAGAAREQASGALAAALPRLDAVGNAAYANPNARVFPQQAVYRGTWDAAVQLTWAPTDAPAAAAGRRGALARARALDAERAALMDAIDVEVTQSSLALGEARAAVETARPGLAAAEESYRVRRVLFQNGRATSVELTDAETELTRARLDLVGAQIDVRVAQARLTHAVGRDAR
jgi:outer membrane protein TolC